MVTPQGVELGDEGVDFGIGEGALAGLLRELPSSRASTRICTVTHF